MSFKIVKNNGIDMLTKNGRFIQSIDNFKKDIKSTSSGKVPAFISNVYKNSDNKIMELIEKQILKKANKINIGGKIYNTSELKTKFKINNKQQKELIINSSLRKPVFSESSGVVSTLDITKKPLAFRDFGIKTKSDLVMVFSGKVDKINDIKFSFTSNKIKTNYTINFIFGVKFSDSFEKRVYTINVNNTYDNLSNSNYVKNNYFNEVTNKYKNAIEITNIRYNIIASFNNKSKSINNMIMLKSNNIKLHNLYNNIIDLNNNGNCVDTYLNKIWGSRYKDYLNTPNDIYKYCVNKNIKTICYDIYGNIINSNYPTKANKHYKSLIYICYDNHIYPLKNQYLEKNNNTNYEIKTVKLINQALKNTLNNNIIPSQIKLNKNNDIVSFVSDNIKYIYNPEYNICKKILDIFGLSDKIHDTIRISSLGAIIEKLYLNGCVSSFMPINYTKEPFIYKNNNIVYNEITTIDKNKCYSNSLYNLEFLIKTDIRCNELYEYVIVNNLMFIDEYLYIAEPDKSTLLMPNKDFYSGQYLNYCKTEGLKFKVESTLICEKTSNIYKNMINDIYNKLNFNITPEGHTTPINCGKYILNILIGKFNQPIKQQTYKTNINIVATDNLEYYEGHIKPINKDYNIIYDTYNDVKYIYNKIPIDIQIKDESRKILYEKMKELNINNDNIIQIKTDSITVNKKIVINESNLFTGWKYETFNPINSNDIIKLKNIDLYSNINLYNCVLYDCYAGAGKSTHILNTYKNKDNYIILTPKHNANTEYKLNAYNCDVIQKYEFSGELPKEQIIIVDEVGQVSRKGWEVIFKCAFMGKEVKLYGDFKQVNNIDNVVFNTNFWRNLFYYDIKMINTNFRNNNTIEYYNDIINGKYNYNELVKYNDINSNNIIVYRNDTRIKYNNKICIKKGINNIYDVGNKIICIDNDLKDINIYNGAKYIIKECYNDYIMTTEGIKITKKQLKHFDYAWAMTIHKLQGDTLLNMYVAPEDNKFYKNNVLYTIISRLKEPLSPEMKAANNKLIHCWN
jgi:hypothetical protein